MDHPDPERGAWTVLRRVRRRAVLVSVDARLERVPAVACEIEDEHPATAHPELTFAAHVLHHRIDHPRTEQNERHADEPLQDRIDPAR